jgi:hypothetical protein
MALFTRTLRRPNHPARLGGILALSVGAYALVAAAAGAILYVIDSERDARRGPAAVAVANVDLPAGMVLVRRIDGPDTWKDALGFAPIVPRELPAGVAEQPLYMLQPEDDGGWRSGHIRYSSVSGLALVLVEQELATAANALPRTVQGEESLMIIELVECGEVLVQAQLYFDIAATDATEARTVTDDFVAGLRAQCA